MAVLLAVSAFDACFAQQAPPRGNTDTKTAETVIEQRIIKASWAAARALAAGAEARVAAAAGEAALKNPYGAAAAVFLTPSRIAREELAQRPLPPKPTASAPSLAPPQKSRKGQGELRKDRELTKAHRGPAILQWAVQHMMLPWHAQAVPP